MTRKALRLMIIALLYAVGSLATYADDRSRLDDFYLSPSCGITCVDEPGESLFENDDDDEEDDNPYVAEPATPPTSRDFSGGAYMNDFRCHRARAVFDMQDVILYRVSGRSIEDAVDSALVASDHPPRWYVRLLRDVGKLIYVRPDGVDISWVAEWLCAGYSPTPKDDHYRDTFACDADCRYAMQVHDRLDLRSEVFDAHR